MKRKFISALLFGALIAASTSTFVSCAKDYDGDIAELREKITGNATDLSSLVDEKVKNVQAEIDALTAQQSALEAAYKEADKALEEAIKNATNDAQGYADIQAAEAQKAAIAAAEEMVSTAAASLQAGLDAANAKLDEQGKTVEGLLAADKELSVSINDAKQRADNAYTLATENGESITKISNDLKEISSSLSTVNSNVTTLQGTVNEALTQANKNKADLDALKTQLESLSGDNKTALKNLSDKDDELQKLIEDNQKKIESALADEAKDREEADKKLQEAIEVVEKSYEDLKGKVETAQTDIDTLKLKAESLDSAIKEEAEERKKANEELSNSIKKLEENITTINFHLTALFENLDNLITGIIVQDTTQIKMLYAKVKNSETDLDQTSASSELTIFETGKAYFPYKGATGAATLATQKYNVEKNIGLLYFTLNPNTIDFSDKANLGLENSLGDAPSDIEVGTVESASGHLITRAASNNGLYQARLTNTEAQMDEVPSYKNSFALYSKYTSKNAKDSTIEHRVYSKYEIDLKATEATATVIPQLGATGNNKTDLADNGGWLFTATNGTLTGTLTLGTTGDNKAYAKYVEVFAVKNSANSAVEGTNLTAAKADFEKNSTGINEVLYEAQDGKESLFDQITVGVSDTYNGYTFTLRYFIQQYDGVVRMETKDVRFTKPMFTSESIAISPAPASASTTNEFKIEGDTLAKLNYMRVEGSNYNTWKANTKYLAVTGDAPITSVKFGYGTNQVVTVNKGGDDTDISNTILGSGNGKVTSVTVVYNPASLELNKEYSFAIESKDANKNVVTSTTVKIKMVRPTWADAQLLINPGIVPTDGGVLEAWAVANTTSGGIDYASYTISQPFANPYTAKTTDADNSWAVRIDVDGKADYEGEGKYVTYKPEQFSYVSTSATENSLEFNVPLAAVKYGEEHPYTMLYGPQYYGMEKLWSSEYNGYRFEDGGSAPYNGKHSFKIKLKSPLAYATANAKFNKDSYSLTYPNGKRTIGRDEIDSDDPTTSAEDPIKFLTKDGDSKDSRIKGSLGVTLVDKKYEYLFESYGVEQTSAGTSPKTYEIVIKAKEGTSSVAINATVKFTFDVTDQFGNTVGIPFKVKVTN